MLADVPWITMLPRPSMTSSCPSWRPLKRQTSCLTPPESAKRRSSVKWLRSAGTGSLLLSRNSPTLSLTCEYYSIKPSRIIQSYDIFFPRQNYRRFDIYQLIRKKIRNQINDYLIAITGHPSITPTHTELVSCSRPPDTDTVRNTNVCLSCEPTICKVNIRIWHFTISNSKKCEALTKNARW